MKTVTPSLRSLLPVLALTAAWPLRADDPAKPAASAETKSETKSTTHLRVIANDSGGTTTTTVTAPHVMVNKMVHRVGANVEKENATWLGVDTAPVSATLASQLNLAEGSGLVVSHVVKDSPAESALKTHDILLKLDDQILIETRQLAVLVRQHKDGDEVTLTYLRGGKETTAKVKLAKHEVPKLNAFFIAPSGSGAAGGGGFAATSIGPGFAYAGNFDDLAKINLSGDQRDDTPEARAATERMLALIKSGHLQGVRRLDVAGSAVPGDKKISVTVDTGDSNLVLEDEKGSLDLSIKDGKKTLVAKNPKGEQVFSGPVNTPEERKALPEEVRSRLQNLEDSSSFSYKTDADFTGAETRVIMPGGQSIVLPLPVRHPAPERVPAAY